MLCSQWYAWTVRTVDVVALVELTFIHLESFLRLARQWFVNRYRIIARSPWLFCHSPNIMNTKQEGSIRFNSMSIQVNTKWFLLTVSSTVVNNPSKSIWNIPPSMVCSNEHNFDCCLEVSKVTCNFKRACNHLVTISWWCSQWGTYEYCVTNGGGLG